MPNVPFASSSSLVAPQGGPGLAHASPEGKAAGLAVQALARASRSFLLYDSQNALVRQMLELFRDTTRQAMEVCGDLPLDFGPFEVSLRGEVIYQDNDREKSLPFKLFRDGVRRLTFRRGVTTEELFHLLEVIALRYTAMRQQEDDCVTLLRRAGFRSIELVGVSGFAPAEERPEADGASHAHFAFAGPAVEPPPDFDTPLPALNVPRRVGWVEVDPAELAALQAEEADEAWAMSAITLGRALLREANRGPWPVPRTDLLSFFNEVRDAMVADAAFAALKILLVTMEEEQATELLGEVLSAFSRPEALDVALDAIPGEHPTVPSELVDLLPIFGGASPLDRLLVEKDPRRSQLLVQLVLAGDPATADGLIRRLPSLPPALLLTLGPSLTVKLPQAALEIARLLLASPEVGTKLAGLEALAVASGDGVMTVLLLQLDSPMPEVRRRALDVVLRRGEPVAATRLVQVLEHKERPLDEVDALGRALARIAPVVAAKHFLAWAQPPARPTPQQVRLQWAAVSGMAVLRGATAEKLLATVKASASMALAQHCQAALDEIRRASARG